MSDNDIEEVKSPCVSICALDMNDVCVGCHRTGDEITQWWGMDKKAKLAALEKAKEREKGSYI
tara:strand:+ start:38912 stop:39100 length:189 start_codon:yes stop_codon:yes gene_type:complete